MSLVHNISRVEINYMWWERRKLLFQERTRGHAKDKTVNVLLSGAGLSQWTLRLGWECSVWRGSWPADVGDGLPSLRRKTAWETEPKRESEVMRAEPAGACLPCALAGWENNSGNTQIRWSWNHQCGDRLQKWKLQSEKWTKTGVQWAQCFGICYWWSDIILEESNMLLQEHKVQVLSLQSEIQCVSPEMSIYTANAFYSCWASHCHPVSPCTSTGMGSNISMGTTVN